MKRLLLLMLLLSLPAPAPAAGQDATRLALPNGLRVILKPNPSTDIVAIELLLDIPAFDEPAERSGIRELVQRLLLRGTETESGDSMNRRLAAAGGLIDATAGLDYVEVYAVVPADGFASAVSLLAQAVQHPAFQPEEIAKQKLALQQLAQSASQDPFQETYLAFRSALYRDHPYGRSTLGDAGSRGRITRDDLLRFHAQHYRPNRAVLAICGGVGQGQAMRSVRQEFSAWPPEEPAARSHKPPSPLACSEVVARELPISRAHVILGFSAPAADKPGYFAAQVLDSLLSGGATARLPQSLRERLGLVYDTSSFYPTLANRSHLAVHAVTQPEFLDPVKAAIIEVLSDLCRRPVPEAELTRAKRYLLGSYALSHQRMKDHAYALAWYEILGLGADATLRSGEAPSLRSTSFEERYQESIQAVSASQVQETAQALLRRFVLAVTMPST